ncbi:hypothetical protein ACHQM5_026219 [Ranunculus cassubicifolius]
MASSSKAFLVIGCLLFLLLVTPEVVARDVTKKSEVVASGVSEKSKSFHVMYNPCGCCRFVGPDPNHCCTHCKASKGLH